MCADWLNAFATLSIGKEIAKKSEIIDLCFSFLCWVRKCVWYKSFGSSGFLWKKTFRRPKKIRLTILVRHQQISNMFVYLTIVNKILRLWRLSVIKRKYKHTTIHHWKCLTQNITIGTKYIYWHLMLHMILLASAWLSVVLHVDVGDGQTKEVRSSGSPASRAMRRGNRRLTRNESRYHSGKGSRCWWLKQKVVR